MARLNGSLLGGWLAATMLLLPLPAHSHAVETRYSGLISGGLLELNSSFSTGEPLVDAEVRLESHDGSQTIPLGATDSDGRFAATLPELESQQWDVVIDGGIGHRDYLGLDEAVEVSRSRLLMRWLAGSGLLGATLALTGSISHGQRQRRP